MYRMYPVLVDFVLCCLIPLSLSPQAPSPLSAMWCSLFFSARLFHLSSSQVSCPACPAVCAAPARLPHTSTRLHSATASHCAPTGCCCPPTASGLFPSFFSLLFSYCPLSMCSLSVTDKAGVSSMYPMAGWHLLACVFNDPSIFFALSFSFPYRLLLDSFFLLC